ncbi:MAG: imidazole glycerol phosphate synthase subunit HisH [Alphaproteobacteria bacterium]|nr:imidazole glycerol phosphate synthase subunit HisH [Alphaproteobacteria bacterium]
MSGKVTVVDYGSGNLLSVCRALRHCGADLVTTENRTEIARAERLVVPGVGAMADSMRNLEARDLVGPIQDYAQSERPMLGICVGMQIMFEAGEEFGIHPGLGLLPGRVRKMPATQDGGARRKIPQIGWNTLKPAAGINSWEGTILQGLPPEPAAYFLHSFAVDPIDPSTRLADCEYEGLRICSAVRKGSIYGCQFHPEKSAEIGLAILRNFLAL